jgi:hypothetical protein
MKIDGLYEPRFGEPGGLQGCGKMFRLSGLRLDGVKDRRLTLALQQLSKDSAEPVNLFFRVVIVNRSSDHPLG